MLRGLHDIIHLCKCDYNYAVPCKIDPPGSGSHYFANSMPTLILQAYLIMDRHDSCVVLKRTNVSGKNWLSLDVEEDSKLNDRGVIGRHCVLPDINLEELLHMPWSRMPQPRM